MVFPSPFKDNISNLYHLYSSRKLVPHLQRKETIVLKRLTGERCFFAEFNPPWPEVTLNCPYIKFSYLINFFFSVFEKIDRYIHPKIKNEFHQPTFSTLYFNEAVTFCVEK